MSTYPPPEYSHTNYPPPRLGCSGFLMTLLVILVLAVSAPWLAQQIMYRATYGKQQAEVEIARSVIGEFKNTTEAFRLVAQSMGPSVVHIDTEQILGGEGREILNGWRLMLPRRRLAGQGSGVIVDKEGYILTNYHVVANATRLAVNLSDGRKITDAAVIGADAATDLAVIRINADNLIPAPWGDSDALEVGDWVLAVGNPYGLDRTVTAGIISAKGRRGVIGGNLFQDFLQTDCAVNPGNSGGPLVNLSGEIVGINTAIVGEAFQGISFAIPSRMVKEVYEQIRKSGSVERGYLGVLPQDLTEELAQQLGVKGELGAVVTRVMPDSPAAEAGIQEGDVIVSWDGHPIQNAGDLTLKVAGTQIGKKVEAKIIRNNREMTVDVTVGSRPTDVRMLQR
jgi:serine protease Do